MAEDRRRLVVSSSARDRCGAVVSWLRERSGDRLLLAPSRRAADELAREVAGSGLGQLGLHRATVSQVAWELAAPLVAARHGAPVSGVGFEALTARSVALRRDDPSLEPFAPVTHFPGFVTALARTLRDLRLADVDPDRLAASGTTGLALAELLAALEAGLEEAGLADRAIILQAAIGALEAGRWRLGGCPVALLDLRPRAGLEARFVSALVAAGGAAIATASPADEEGIEAWSLILGEAEVVEVPDLEPGRLGRLRRALFRTGVEEEAGEDGSWGFFAAAGEGQECVEIARRISTLAGTGVAFDRMAVLVRHPGAYQPLLEAAFARGEIPGYWSRGTRRPDPAGRAFLALLGCAAEGLSAARFAEYLSLGQAPPEGGEPEEGAPWVEPDDEQLVFKGVATPSTVSEDPRPSPGSPRRWERLIVDAAVVGGRDRWRVRLDGLAAEIGAQVEALEGDDEARREALLERGRRLGALRRFALPIIDRLAELPSEASWGRWLPVLRELAHRTLRRPESVLRLLAELEPMADVARVDLDEVRLVLGPRLSQLLADPPSRPYGRVFVGTVDEAAGRSFRVVFLPGLAEGLFPRPPAEDPLLLDELRLAVDDRLPTQEARVAEERLRLHFAVGAAEERLVASYPTLDTLQGRARVPSFYALDLIRAATGRLPELGELERLAVGSATSRLGWPAPKKVVEALDDAEFDLGILGPLLAKPAAEVRGAARYLLEVNGHLARSLRARGRRWRRRFFPEDGLVDPGAETRALLAEARPSRGVYSPTALQHFAACPYRFLLSAVHRLRPREESVALEQMDPLTRGGLFHAVQFRSFQRLASEGLLPVDSGLLPRALEVIDEVLATTAGEWAAKLAPAIPRVWASEVDGIGADLRGWLKAVVEAGPGWRPRYFELAFGLPSRPEQDPASRPEPIEMLGGPRLRGAIDLVEERADGATLRVTDHKTGRARHRGPLLVGGGTALQPVLYALAVEGLFDRSVESGRLFYCTHRGGFESVEVPLDERSRAAVARVVDEIDGAMVEGFLPAAPAEGACRYCDYRLVCGPHEELRTRRKRSDRLTRLRAVRELR